MWVLCLQCTYRKNVQNRDPIGKEMADNLMLLNFINEQRVRNLKIKREYMPYGRVLIVDDVESNLYVARGLMASYDLSIDTALSGFEAVDKIKNKCDYDVIFMDHMMPGMDGIETTKIIRDLGYTKPIVALTANALAGQSEMFLKNGFDDFISKPIDTRQLNMTLNKLVRDRYPAEVVEAARKQREMLNNKINQLSSDSHLAEFFIRDAKKSAKILETIYINKCRRADDVSMFIINVHAMKSALANVGEKDLSQKALILEQLGRDNNIKNLLEELPEFLKSLYSIIHEYEENEQKVKKEGHGDHAQLKEKYLEIRAECEIYNKKAAKDILKDLKKKEWPQFIDEQLSILTALLLHSEFDEAVKNIDDYLSML